MNTIFDNVYDTLFAPRTALRRIAAGRPLGQAVLVFLISVLVPVIPMYFTMGGLHFAAGIIIVGQLIVSILMWFIGAAILGLLAELFGGKGQSSSLFTALGFAHIPRMLLVPGLLIASIMPPAVKTLLDILFIAGVFIWSLMLDVTAIRETYGLSGARSVLVLITPLFLVMMLAVCMVIAAGAMVAQLPFSLDNVLVE